MCKDCKCNCKKEDEHDRLVRESREKAHSYFCRKTLDYSDMAKQLLTEFAHIMPRDCHEFLEKIEEKKVVSTKQFLKSKYPLQ
jgi:hypothetical protein